KYTITRWPRNEDSETSLPSASSNVNSGAGSPGASRLSVIGPPVGCGWSRECPYERGQRAKGPAAMADRVLGFRGHLGGGLAESVGQEDRVVAEPAAATRCADQPALDPAGHHPLPGGGGGDDQGGGADELGAEPGIGHVGHLGQDQFEVGLV